MENKTITEVLQDLDKGFEEAEIFFQSLGFKGIMDAGDEAEKMLKIIGEGNC